MSDGGPRRFDVVTLPRDTARLVEHVVDAAGMWATAVALGMSEGKRERELYRELCYARKWLCEHLEELTREERGERVTLRFL